MSVMPEKIILSVYSTFTKRFSCNVCLKKVEIHKNETARMFKTYTNTDNNSEYTYWITLHHVTIYNKPL